MSEHPTAEPAAIGETGESQAPSPSGGAAAGPACVVIEGETTEGKRFRPSDWNERLHGTLRALDEDEYQACHGFVRLTTMGGRKCVQVDCKLREQDERLFNFFLRFARDNHLRTREFTAEEWEQARKGENR